MSLSSMRDHLPRPSLRECGLCLESSRRLLPCSHTFCLDCLKHILRSQTRSDSFPCPTCRSPTDIPPGGVEGLQNGFNWKVNRESSPSTLFIPETVCAKGEGNARTRTETKPKRMAQERTCIFHQEELLRFYCTRCSTPICRDCKLTSHEGHPATDLYRKSTEAKSLIFLVMQMSQANLEPRLRQILQEAENHKKSLPQTKKKILGTLTQRSERLKEMIDQALSKATEQLNEETADADRLVSTYIENMEQGLASFISFTEHAQNIATNRCNADVVEFLPRLKNFFAQASQQNTDDFEILEETTLLSGGTCSTAEDRMLRPFLTDEWKMKVQLSESSPTKECPFCSFRYSQRVFTCPKCCTDSAKTPTSRNIFGLRVKRSGCISGPQLQCQACSRKYDASFEFCPICGMLSSQDALTTIRTFIPQYLGHVSQKHQSAEEKMTQSHSSDSKEGTQSNMSRHAISPPLRTGSEGREILNTLSTISSLLQEWK